MKAEQALDLLVKTNISPENVRGAEAVLRRALKGPESPTEEVRREVSESLQHPVKSCPGCGRKVRVAGEGTTHWYEPVEPVVLARAWHAKGDPFKVRSPKGAPDDVAVLIIEDSEAP